MHRVQSPYRTVLVRIASAHGRIPNNLRRGDLESEFIVRSYELDSLGHVNHAIYLNYFEQARYDYLAAGGIAPAEMAQRGWRVHIVRAEVEYRRECRLGQTLTVRTWIDQVRKSSMTVCHELRRDADGPDMAPAVTARMVAVWVGENNRPMRIPEEAKAALTSAGRAAPGAQEGNV